MSISRLTTNGLTGTKYDVVSADNYYMEPIATQLLASTATTVTFDNIPQGYKHLQVRFIARTGRASFSDDNMALQLNGDTGSNYAWHQLSGDGSAASSGASTTTTDLRAGRLTGATATAGNFGTGVIDILDYSNVYKFKTLRTLSGNDNNGSGTITLFSGLWQNTAAVTSIKLFSQTGSNSFQVNTRFSLYGVKA